MNVREMVLAKMLVVILIVLFTGCAGSFLKNMGSFEMSVTATDNFNNFMVNSDYNYFLSGSDVYPVAIFGLKKTYTLNDENLWKKIDPNQEVIAQLVSNMQRRLLECCIQNAYGFDILDDHGHKIGEWYSMLGLIIAVQLKEEGKVVIYPPVDTDAVKRYQDRGNGRAR